MLRISRLVGVNYSEWAAVSSQHAALEPGPKVHRRRNENVVKKQIGPVSEILLKLEAD